MRRWHTWALIASLGLNLAFVGLLAGAWFKGPPPPPLPGFWHYARALPEPYERALARAFREDDKGGPRGGREQARADREALADLLTAEPDDPAAVRALLDAQVARAGVVVSRSEALLMEQVGRMTPADRAAYAEALRHAPQKPDGPPRR